MTARFKDRLLLVGTSFIFSLVALLFWRLPHSLEIFITFAMLLQWRENRDLRKQLRDLKPEAHTQGSETSVHP